MDLLIPKTMHHYERHFRTTDRPAGVGIPTYLEYGGGVDHGGSPSRGSFGVTAVGSNRIVVGDKIEIMMDL